MADLPENFLASMKELLGEEFHDYLDCFSKERISGIRVNTNKISVERFREICPFPIRPIPWIPNGFYYDKEDNPSRHPYYAAGLYYIQEPSAMTPADLLPVEPGDFVCDLCAAPGGKATELGAKLKGKGFLLANDISNSRAKGLLKNLELFGLHNICISSEAPEKLLEKYGTFFDKILIDAPCSGEGMFRRDPNLIKSYREHGPAYYSPIQKEIILAAADLLKPGGYMVYSTCTFSTEEDEDVISYLLTERKDFTLCDVSSIGKSYEGFSSGRKGLSECVRIFPHCMEGEGHFIALLHKSGTGEEKGKTILKEQKPYRNDSLTEFLQKTKTQLPQGEILCKSGEVYLLSEPSFAVDGIRFLRTGLHLGSVEKNRFEPSQALAMASSIDGFSNVLNLSCEDERTIRYLKGETIPVAEGETTETKGWCLVAVDGFPLGFGKRNGNLLKNKYKPGWRWM